jgi:hypothetical protein
MKTTGRSSSSWRWNQHYPRSLSGSRFTETDIILSDIPEQPDQLAGVGADRMLRHTLSGSVVLEAHDMGVGELGRQQVTQPQRLGALAAGRRVCP